MKSIKYIISIALLLGSIVSSAQIYYAPTSEWVSPNYSNITITTPNNSSVSVKQWLSNDWTPNYGMAQPITRLK